MSKRTKKFIIMDEDADVVYGVSVTDGSVHVLVDQSDTIGKQDWVSEARVMTAAEALKIGEVSARRAKEDEITETSGNYDVTIQQYGDVQIGCQHYDSDEVADVVKLVRKFAKGKSANK